VAGRFDSETTDSVSLTGRSKAKRRAPRTISCDRVWGSHSYKG
jgi:hypothetical protein